MTDNKNSSIKDAAAGIDLLEELSRLNNELAGMHRELAKKNVELARLNEEKNQFVGMAAHDIRKPLAIITTYSEILKEDTAHLLDAEHAEFLSLIEATGRAALDVVNSFLDMSKIEAGVFDLNLQPGDLMEQLRCAVRFNKPLAQKKNIVLNIKEEAAVVQLVFDAQKIAQVLDNLISNAIKFSPFGAQVDCALVRDKESVIVSVRDYAQGIPQHELDRLFKPFGKTSVRSTNGESSTGLGLAISKKIVAAHGGVIWVETAEEKGATFFFSLPARE